MNKNWKVIDIKSHPIKNGCWVEVIAEIRNNETSEIRQYLTHEILMNGEDFPSTFNWAENNYSCDCNRRIFFNRVNDIELENEYECSDGNFSVQLINPVNNKIYYSEF